MDPDFMISKAILEPVMILVLWNCVMLVWLYATRIPAVMKMGEKLDPTLPSGQQMSQLPPRVRWKADNYNHLLEQPVIFYVTAITLALLGSGDGVNLMLAWTYVGLRIVHSLVQATWNKIVVRFSIFILASIILIGLVVRTILLLWS